MADKIFFLKSVQIQVIAEKFGISLGTMSTIIIKYRNVTFEEYGVAAGKRKKTIKRRLNAVKNDMRRAYPG